MLAAEGTTVAYEVRCLGLACASDGCTVKRFATLQAASDNANEMANFLGEEKVYLLRIESLPLKAGTRAERE